MKTKTGFTKAYLLSKLVEASEVLGHSPSERDSKRLSNFPSRGAYRNHFGTFAKAMTLAGLPLVESGSANPNHLFHFENPVRKKKLKHKRINSSKNHLAFRFKILKRDNFTCQYCGRTPQDGAKLVVDHIVPFSKGGETIEENLITSCFECNAGKGDVLLDLNSLKRKPHE